MRQLWSGAGTTPKNDLILYLYSHTTTDLVYSATARRVVCQVRPRRKKERKRAQKRQPNCINLDLPVDLKKRLELLAKKEGVPISLVLLVGNR